MDYLLGVSGCSRTKNKSAKNRRAKRSVIGQRRRQCAFCPRTDSSYTCPQCDRHYCSSECYTSQFHRDCSEHFFKKCIFQQLKSQNADEDDKKKLVDILKRNANSQNQDILDLLNYLQADDCDQQTKNSTDYDIQILKDPNLVEFSEKLIEKLNCMNIENANDLDRAINDLWNEFDSGEKDRFTELVNRNSKLFNDVIVDWTPWWRSQKWNRPVEDVTSPCDKKEEEEYSDSEEECRFPILYKNIEHISKLTTQTPSPSLLYSIIVVTFAYSYIVKLYNGEIVVDSRSKHRNPEVWSADVFDILMEYAPVLSSNTKLIFKNCDEAIQYCMNNILTNNNDGFVKVDDKILVIELLNDVLDIFTVQQTNVMTIQDDNEKIIKLPKNLVYLLSDLLHILENIELSCTEEKTLTKDIVRSRKKLYFYLCWTFDYGEEAIRRNCKQISNSVQFVCEQLRQEIGLFESEQSVEIQ